MRKSSALACLLLAGWAASSTAIATDPDDATGFEYLYIVANENGSSGGHTAIRFGRDVYHFQNEDDLLVLHRDRADEFLYSYALLENRTIHSTRVAMSEETRSSLVEHFRQRHRAQEAQIGIQRDLRRDRELLEFLAEREKDPSKQAPDRLLSIAGLGYFESSPPASDERSAILDSLRSALVRAYGPGFVEARRSAIARERDSLLEEDPAHWRVAMPTSASDHPIFARSYSSRWVDLRAARAALDVLEEARGLEAGARRAPEDDAFSLEPEDVAALERYAAKLAGQLVETANSRRADWGQTLLVGMARLAALEASIATGQLVFLDTYPDEPESIIRLQAHRDAESDSGILSESHEHLASTRAYFRDHPDPDELAWQRLEEASNRHLELLRAEQHGGTIRVARGHLVPSRSGVYPIAARPSGAYGSFATNADRARRRERDYAREMRRLHAYGLITRNCVTAIFDTLNASFDDSERVSEQQLGGHVGKTYSLTFIPFVSAQKVNEQYRVTRQEKILSYRKLRLREMKEREGAIRVAFRESNTLTAKSYRRHQEDSFFVFFTDGTPLLRPLFGAINLVAGLGETVAGLLTAPLDRGARLTRGLRGSFVSLPELLFMNIRKGTNDWIPAEHRDLESVVVSRQPRMEPVAPGRLPGSRGMAAAQ